MVKIPQYFSICNDRHEVDLKTFPDATFDALVTDPPYGIGMKKWDKRVPTKRTWRGVYRVMKPGAYGVAFFATRTYHKGVTELEKAGFQILDSIAWIYFQGFPRGENLKPSWEPICLFRKPTKKRGLNIDDCRIGDENGRHPANLIHDGQPETIAAFPQSAGQVHDVKAGIQRKKSNVYRTIKATTHFAAREDTGSAARFFFCAKASPSDRDNGLPQGKHNTGIAVKPTELMRYLCRLITPRGGLILDPYCGTGSTGRGALLEGFRFYGIEQDKESFEIAVKRCDAILDGKYDKPDAPDYTATNDSQLTLL